MDILPPINKMFSLISQNEHQKNIGNHINTSLDSTGTMAFVVKTDNSKASRDYKGQKKIYLSILIATFMVIPLINVTKYMDVHLITNLGRGIILLIPTITLLLIKYQTSHSLILLSRLINQVVLEISFRILILINISNFCLCFLLIQLYLLSQIMTIRILQLLLTKQVFVFQFL